MSDITPTDLPAHAIHRQALNMPVSCATKPGVVADVCGVVRCFFLA